MGDAAGGDAAGSSEGYEQCPDPALILAYVGHDLGALTRGEILDHLDRCASCRQVVALAALGDEETLPSSPGSRRIAGRYRIVRLIDAGGMGLVYEAEDPQLGRRVAIKMLHRQASGGELRREARALAALQHPNVVRVYDVGTVDACDYIVMELLEGGTLGQWLAESSRSRREILAAFASVAQGLAAVHAVGLVHRDFKPANVLRRPDGSFAVTDFGLSTEAETLLTTSVTDGQNRPDTHPRLVGTPAYMAPEQRDGEPATARSDQFSFALCVLEALSGRRADPLAVRSLPIPKAARSVLERGLSITQDERYASVTAFWRAFVRAMHVRVRRSAVAVAALVCAGLVGSLYMGTAPAQPVAFAPTSAEPVATFVGNPAVQEQIQLAYKAARADSFSEGLRHLDTAVELARLDPREPQLALALRQRALFLNRLNRHDEALASSETDTEGRHSDAVPLLEQTLDVFEALEPRPLTFIAAVRHDLARAHCGQGHYRKAIAELEVLLDRNVTPEMREELRPDTNTSLARAYLKSGSYALALAPIERALVFIQGSKGSSHPDWGLAAVLKARALSQLGQIERGVAVYDAALEVLGASFGVNAPQAAWARQLRAVALAKHEPATAKEEIERSIAVFIRQSPTSPYLSAAYEDLAEVEALLRDVRAARVALRRGLEVHRLLNPADHPVGVRMAERLAELDP